MASPKSALIALSAMIVPIGTACPQQSPMPPEIAAKLQEIGRVVEPPATAPRYAQLQEKEPLKVGRRGLAARRAGNHDPPPGLE